jgi:UDP-N-acetylglucosamine pyrophosphorylase
MESQTFVDSLSSNFKCKFQYYANPRTNFSGMSSCCIPLVIMTSDDTHLRTEQLLKENNFFGMSHDQIHLLKQVHNLYINKNSPYDALCAYTSIRVLSYWVPYLDV